MNYDLNPKKIFEFSRRSAMNNTRVRRSSYFQFNNRRNNFRKYSGWPEFHGVSKPWGACLQKPGVQDARFQASTSSLAAVNPHQPFIPKVPVNLIVTIPNFSGVCPPDLFAFRNSSAKSESFSSAPASMFRSCLPANKDVGPTISNKTEISDDVQYLYTVKTESEQLVEVVDLTEDFEGPSSDKLEASDHFSSNSTASSEAKECGNSRMISKMLVKETVQSSEKQNHKGRKRKKSSEDLHCDICESEYEFVRSRGEEIFKARCGHMFCQECLKKLDSYKCPECNLYLQKLFKVFL